MENKKRALLDYFKVVPWAYEYCGLVLSGLVWLLWDRVIRKS